MFFNYRHALALLPLLLVIACPAFAQKDIEDLPIADVVPTAVPTKLPSKLPSPVKTTVPTPLPKATTQANVKPISTDVPTVTAKPTAAAQALPRATAKTSNVEDAPIADVPAVVTPSATPPSKTMSSGNTANIEDSSPEDPTPAPPAITGSHAQPDESHFDEAHTEPAFPADDGHTVGWFDLWHTFQKPWLRQALYAGLLVAFMCSFLGVYVVLKRIVFVGVALAELSSAGIAIGLWLGFSPIWGAMLLMLLGVAMFAVRWSPRRVPTESVIGIVYSVAGAAAILCIAKSAMGETHMLTLLQGDVLTVAAKETWEMLGIFTGVALLHALFNKEFLLVSFDRDAAATMGYNALGWDFLLYLTIGIVIAFSIRATGVLMATTLLIIPAVTALLLAPNIKRVWPLAIVCGMIPVIIGLHLSLLLDLPASAVIVALSFLLLLPVLALSSLRRA